MVTNLDQLKNALNVAAVRHRVRQFIFKPIPHGFEAIFVGDREPILTAVESPAGLCVTIGNKPSATFPLVTLDLLEMVKELLETERAIKTVMGSLQKP